MRAAARLTVKSLDFDGPENSFALHFLANARFGKLFGRAEADYHRTVFKDDVVRPALGFFQMARNDAGCVEINRRKLPAQVKRDSLKSEELDECRREQVLRRVLLHVIDASRPINLPVYGTHRYLGRSVVDYGVIRADCLPARVDDLDHRSVAQPPQIVRLPPRRRIEGRLVQYDLPAVAFRLARHHLGVEFPQKRVAIVEPVRQVSSFSQEIQDSMESAV